MGKINNRNALLDGIVWVLLRYPDGSEFCFQTTLNQAILSKYQVTLEEGCLVRLDKMYFENGKMVYRQFPFAGATVSMWDAETYTDELSASLREFM